MRYYREVYNKKLKKYFELWYSNKPAWFCMDCDKPFGSNKHYLKNQSVRFVEQDEIREMSESISYQFKKIKITKFTDKSVWSDCPVKDCGGVIEYQGYCVWVIDVTESRNNKPILGMRNVTGQRELERFYLKTVQERKNKFSYLTEAYRDMSYPNKFYKEK